MGVTASIEKSIVVPPKTELYEHKRSPVIDIEISSECIPAPDGAVGIYIGKKLYGFMQFEFVARCQALPDTTKSIHFTFKSVKVHISAILTLICGKLVKLPEESCYDVQATVRLILDKLLFV